MGVIVRCGEWECESKEVEEMSGRDICRMGWFWY